MNILGGTVLLRAIELWDKDILKRLINDKETEYLIGGWSSPVSDINQIDWIKSIGVNPHIIRCMIDNLEEHTLGTVILSDIDYKNGIAEIHIKLLKEYQSKGYGADAVNTLVNYAFHELRLQCVYAYINEYNIGSQKLFEKLGFKLEGKLRRRMYKNGSYHDKYIYSALKEEFYGNRQ